MKSHDNYRLLARAGFLGSLVLPGSLPWAATSGDVASAADDGAVVTQQLPLSRIAAVRNRYPHYFVVDMRGNKLAAVHRFRSSDNKEVVTAYPRGHSFAASAKTHRVMGPRAYRRFISRIIGQQRNSTAPNLAAGPVYNTGLALGYNGSTGPTSGQCFNYTTQNPVSPVVSLNFSSLDTASSFAAQTNMSSSVSTSLWGFKAKDSFSFSDQYSSSANSGSVYFNAQAIYSLNSTIPSKTPLNAQGSSALSAGNFSQLCGVEYTATVPAGMIVVGEFSWFSDSSAASQAIANNFKSSYGGSLARVANAVQSATQVANAQWGIGFSVVVEGGGSAASQQIITAYDNAETALNQCAQGNVTSCNTFATQMDAGATQGIGTFQQGIPSTGSMPTNLSNFAAFPNGVAGVSFQTNLQPVPTGKTVNDALLPYKSQLQQYVTLLNQIATLYNRSSYLYEAVGQPSFNPINTLNLQNYLYNAEYVYSGDKSTLMSNLSNCLSSNQQNVTTACAPILNNSVTNAYDWYAAGGPNPNSFSAAQNWLAQQNTIGLQYTGLFTPPTGSGGPFPIDVLYVDTLPPFTGTNGQVIGGQSSLTGFADATYYWNGNSTNPMVSLLALPNGTDLGTIYSTALTKDWLGIGTNGAFFNSLNGLSFAWTTPTCTPTFNLTCTVGFDVEYGPPIYAESWNYQESLQPIPQFFTTP
jgi:hypothetical protein